MYIIEVSNTVASHWYTGSGWYWMDEFCDLHGPMISERHAVEHYAWHWKEFLETLDERGMIQ